MVETTLHRLEAEQLVDASDIELAQAAMRSGVADHTIGYELEVLSSAASQTPELEDRGKKGAFAAAADAMQEFGYGVCNDGMYEAKSPAAEHPLPLAVATRGLVRAGWLPELATGVVTAHVSVGSSALREKDTEHQQYLVQMLRAVELAGGTTVGRLMAPVTAARRMKEKNARFSWNVRGRLGINTGRRVLEQWEGYNSRAELRTLRYIHPAQFADTLDKVYYLSRGLFSHPKTAASDIYGDFADWFSDYRQTHGLPDEDIASVPAHGTVAVGRLERYLKPYAEHMADHDRRELIGRTRETVSELREEFGMSHLPAGSEVVGSDVVQDRDVSAEAV